MCVCVQVVLDVLELTRSGDCEGPHGMLQTVKGLILLLIMRSPGSYKVVTLVENGEETVKAVEVEMASAMGIMISESWSF